MRELLKSELQKSIATATAAMNDDFLVAAALRAAETISDAMKRGNKLMVAGNGGSAADSQHLVAEFVSRLIVDRPALPAIALTADTSILTAVGNDYSYENVFERQIEAIGRPGDVFLGISTSGNAKEHPEGASPVRKERDCKHRVHWKPRRSHEAALRHPGGRPVRCHDAYPGVSTRTRAHTLHDGRAVLFWTGVRQIASIHQRIDRRYPSNCSCNCSRVAPFVSG